MTIDDQDAAALFSGDEHADAGLDFESDLDSADSSSGAAAQGRLDDRSLSVLFPDAPVVEQTSWGYVVRLPDCQLWAKVGEPLLPVRTVRILLPRGHQVDRVEVETAGPFEIPH